MNDYEVEVTFFVKANTPDEARQAIWNACYNTPGGFGYAILDGAVTLVDADQESEDSQHLFANDDEGPSDLDEIVEAIESGDIYVDEDMFRGDR